MDGNLLRIISIDPDSSILGGEGRFLDIYFDVKSGAPGGCVDLSLERATLLDMNDVPIQTELDSGSLCVGNEAMLGDLNGDGSVTEADVTMLLDIATRRVPTTAYHRLVGDLNGDGRLDSADATLLLRVLNGLPLNPDKADPAKDMPEGNLETAMPSLEVLECSKFSLPVTLNNAQGVTGMDLVISWPAEELRLDTVRAAADFSAFAVGSAMGGGYARWSISSHAGVTSAGQITIAYLNFTVLGRTTTAMNPAPVVRINHTDVKYAYGESHLWFGDITLGAAEIIIKPGVCEGEGEPEGEGEGEPEGEPTPVNVIVDGGFEKGSPNSAWDEYSSVVGSPLCTEDVCGLGSGTGPYRGQWWCWFGGVEEAETGYVKQSVRIPKSAGATLSFYLEMPAANKAGNMSVMINGNEVFRATKADAGRYQTYKQVRLNVSEYADGNTHEIKFATDSEAANSVISFFVDEVSLMTGPFVEEEEDEPPVESEEEYRPPDPDPPAPSTGCCIGYKGHGKLTTLLGDWLLVGIVLMTVAYFRRP